MPRSWKLKLGFTIRAMVSAFFCIGFAYGGDVGKDEKDKQVVFSKSEKYIQSLKNTYRPKKFEGVLEPNTLPDLTENRKTLIGIDLNKDGVRDDLEIFVNRYFEQDYDREIFKKFFRRGAHFFKYAEKMSVQQLQEEVDGFSQDVECSSFLAEFGYIKNLDEFKKRRITPWQLLFNTPMRDNFLGNYLNKLSSSGSGISNGREAFKYCSKYIQHKYPMKKKAI